MKITRLLSSLLLVLLAGSPLYVHAETMAYIDATQATYWGESEQADQFTVVSRNQYATEDRGNFSLFLELDRFLYWYIR